MVKKKKKMTWSLSSEGAYSSRGNKKQTARETSAVTEERHRTRSTHTRDLTPNPPQPRLGRAKLPKESGIQTEASRMKRS